MFHADFQILLKLLRTLVTDLDSQGLLLYRVDRIEEELLKAGNEDWEVIKSRIKDTWLKTEFRPLFTTLVWYLECLAGRRLTRQKG